MSSILIFSHEIKQYEIFISSRSEELSASIELAQQQPPRDPWTGDEAEVAGAPRPQQELYPELQDGGQHVESREHVDHSDFLGPQS